MLYYTQNFKNLCDLKNDLLSETMLLVKEQTRTKKATYFKVVELINKIKSNCSRTLP